MLSSKTAVVTGGGSGIGAAIALALAGAGARVMIGGRSPEKLRGVAGRHPGGRPIVSETLDVARLDDVERFFSLAERELGRVDILVNSAGINVPRRGMAELSPEDWKAVMDVNANVYPGEVETPILDQRPVPVTAEHRARILQPEDVAAAVLMVACLPPRAHVPELTIKPTSQAFA
jgi:NADP-dependent 3-hydroxy acid dehydrogenase YdfG